MPADLFFLSKERHVARPSLSRTQRSLEQCVAYQLASKLARPGCAAATQWHPVFASVLESMSSQRGVPLGAQLRQDLSAVVSRDPACEHKLHALIFFKGFLGIQVRARTVQSAVHERGYDHKKERNARLLSCTRALSAAYRHSESCTFCGPTTGGRSHRSSSPA